MQGVLSLHTTLYIIHVVHYNILYRLSQITFQNLCGIHNITLKCDIASIREMVCVHLAQYAFSCRMVCAEQLHCSMPYGSLWLPDQITVLYYIAVYQEPSIFLESEQTMLFVESTFVCILDCLDICTFQKQLVY